MEVNRGDVIEHNGLRARVMSNVNGWVTVEWCDGRIQSGEARGLWMCQKIASGI